ncbi:MFS transporter [Microbacterium sp.]|uniref:MFS transporter n=1 Tax=Microbacterium sp. TaxID=51671 RepID=UPI003C747354
MTQPTNGVHTANWSGVVAMTVCVFALIASEFMPVSLLTPIAADLVVTEGMTGQGIAISGAFAVVTSLTISPLAGGLNRKPLLLIFTLLMALSGALVGLAPNYAVYMIGRALIGVVVGGFWSMSAATAMRLVPTLLVPRALAIFNGGNALAAVLAAPIGSYLGSVIGWRGTFFCLVPIALAALLWQWISLPSMPAAPRGTGPRHIFGPLRRRPIAIGLAACGAFFMGQFVLFTYVRPFLETVTNVDAVTLSLSLLIVGAAGLVGTALIGRFIARSLSGTLIAVPVLMAIVAVALIPAGPWLAPVMVLLGAWGFLATSAPVGWWSWVARSLPDEAEAGGGLMVAVIQLFTALGSTVGGVLFDTSGYVTTFLAAAAVLLVGALLAALAGRAARAA